MHLPTFVNLGSTLQPMFGRCGFAPKSSVHPTLAFCSGPASEPVSVRQWRNNVSNVPVLARCSCPHLSTSAQHCSQCWGDAVLHQSPAFSQHWHSASGQHRNLCRADIGGIMFPTSARVGKLQLTNIVLQTVVNNIGSCVAPTMAE